MQQDPGQWDERLLAYAFAVGRMKEERPTDPTAWHWSYQTQVHGAVTDPGDGFRHQCQHNSWYFLPWHRMYILQFERIVRAIIAGDPRVSDATKAAWALPYWDYDQPGTRALPFAFRTPTLPDGSVNPLLEIDRGARVNDLVNPVMLSDLQVTSANWIRNRRYTGLASFGGAATQRNHFREFPGNAPGQLEIAPHGAVHNFVNGAMANFDRAAGDAIFWLHHCNIDRLWEVWRLDVGAGADPVDPAFLSSLAWTFRDPGDATVTNIPADVLDTVNQLRYRYEDTSRPASAPPAAGGPAVPANPPRLLGSIESPLSLVGAADEPVTITLTDMPPVLDASSHVSLLVEHITVDGENLPQYGIFLDPGGDVDADLFVGVMPLFGIANADQPGADLSYAYDLTDLVGELIATGRFDPLQASLRFRPINEDAMTATVEETGIDLGAVHIGSISLFLE
jgi:tyrosinase